MKILSYLFTALFLSACSTTAVSSPIVIQSQGEEFYPVQTKQQAKSVRSINTNAPSTVGLYKGQAMQAHNSYTTGKLTGVILVKTTNQESVAQVAAQQATVMGEDFVLLSFDEDTDLYSKLNQLKQRPDVITAEIEVNTQRRQPR